MYSPSSQLLRALRSSTSPSTTLTRTTPSPIPRLTPPRCTTPSNILPLSHRHNSSSSNSNSSSRPTRLIPRAHTAKPSADRAPDSNENKATDLNALNVLGNVPAPTTAVDATLDDGFHLDNGLRIRGGDGVLLVGGEAFAWRPWATRTSRAEMVNAKGQFEVDEEVWGLLGVVWPRPGKHPSIHSFIYLPMYSHIGWDCC